MASKSSGGVDGEAEVEGTAAGLSCFGLGSLDGSGLNHPECTGRSVRGDVGDIGESGMAISAGPGSKRPSPGAAGFTSPGKPVLAGSAEAGSES